MARARAKEIGKATPREARARKAPRQERGTKEPKEEVFQQMVCHATQSTAEA